MEAPIVRKTITLENSHGGANTELEDSIRRLEIGDGRSSLPERPGEPDCVYYLRNGSCGYGDRCRYNHPRGNSLLILGAGEFPERPEQPVCEYYMKNGSCKFGSACKYNHPKQSSGSAQQLVALNSLGFPHRPGEKECNYYLKTGSCKYNSACKFHHPERALTTQVSALVPMNYSAVQSSSLITPVLYPPLPSLNMNLNVGRYPVPPRNYGAMLMPPGVVPAPGWNPYMGAQPCNYYAKHGVCKYGPTCKFDHPMGTLSYTPSTSSLSALSDMPIFPVNLPYSTTTTGDIQPDNLSGTEPISPQLTFSVTVSSCGSNAPVSIGSSISN
ncbi:zinc finger CCCH domain-containing protein 58-like isoform X2 [Carex rostrata]